MKPRFRPSANNHSIVFFGVCHLPGSIMEFCCLQTFNPRKAANPPATLTNDHVETIRVCEALLVLLRICIKAARSGLKSSIHTCRDENTRHSVRVQKSGKQATSNNMFCATTARIHYNSKQNSHPGLNTIGPCSLHAHSPYPELASTHISRISGRADYTRFRLLYRAPHLLHIRTLRDSCKIMLVLLHQCMHGNLYLALGSYVV
ncbi:hypothetical protein HBI56_078330 [Parastagonospora nodorum]|nr:hypothetical protein HBH56_148860 [Parastagonospora nodorum]KAH3923215.1 hypothetical protein HBH54_213500 [Parastagonospora nodorum]KAH3945998.1 hypothetical protein HBH53_136300 [Parastagonospora nodorum]KAH3983682.1 hypothetical protein HBH52_063710 [Parastagonospora nodorum]KAH4054013.1 hypothetical protein HBH49_074700 [Parastagonospora nodorum]